MKTPTILPRLPRTGERRLLKLIGFLEKLPPKKFDFSDVVSEFKENGHACGTVCCAVGWVPAIFPRLVEWFAVGSNGIWYDDRRLLLRMKGARQGKSYDKIAAKLFGMKPTIANALFTPDSQKYADMSLPDVPEDATPKQVARMLRQFLKLTKTPTTKTK